MASLLSGKHVRELLGELRRLTAERAKAESETAQTYRQRSDSHQREMEQSLSKLDGQHRAKREALNGDYRIASDAAMASADEGIKKARSVHGKAREDALEQHQAAEEASNREFQESKWTQDAMLEARSKKAISLREQIRRQYSLHVQAATQLRQEALEQLQEWRLVPPGAGAADRTPSADPMPIVDRHVNEARTLLARLKGLVAPRFLVGDRLLWIIFATWTAISAISYFTMSEWWTGVIVATAVTLVGGFGAWFLLKARARSQVTRIGTQFFHSISETERLSGLGEEAAEVRYIKEIEDANRSHKDEVRALEKKYRKQLAEILQQRDETLQVADHRLQRLTGDYSKHRDSELARLESEQRLKSDEMELAFSKERSRVVQQFEDQGAEIESWHDAAFQAFSEQWRTGSANVRWQLDDIWQTNRELFPNWSGPEWSEWKAPQAVPAGVRFGELAIDVAALPGGQPSDPKLPPFEPDRFAVPALLPFPHRCATLLHVAGDGKQAGVLALQAMMLRFLTSLPPGKVRFTIIDPVGLGENFAAFMHLADFDEQLVGARIWTETAQIEKRLLDTTEHMENVIQKYLRNQYASIEEYNEQAGEVAEPYRVLVVANFPANFSLEAARRLASIASSGASCGVFTLISVDPRQPAPQGFPIADLEQPSVNLRWRNGHFEWDDADMSVYPLTLDAPPDANTTAAIVQTIGAKAKEASRVEVDFEFVAPSAETWWTHDSRAGLTVPLGRSGATKRQMLQLGKGTSQHALVAGKTGSGKSTLLHALVTNLAMHYGPDEVELYLIDFKKGVEFKTYATHELPHARVVAVESEREFGLSVLQRLDAELKRRGDLFRNAGVQDVAAFRDKLQGNGQAWSGVTALPRILLVVDEFQEFFVEDDKLSQEAALLLDRLVRQGRAFGLHVLLGSQTLGGAYSLARSTIDQMAVRIALQCSEADANLILSKDNNAARLLSRPGEAIYNDANGLIEGNDVFQVVWLPEARREVYLDRMKQMARQRKFSPSSPMIVFEGNHPADVEKNHLLQKLLTEGPRPDARERRAWLGDALAIKDPTVAAFRSQSGSNLLVIGQQPEPARAVLAAAIVALAAQDVRGDTPAFAPITILDGSPADDPQAGYFSRLAAALPEHVRLANLRDRPSVLDQLGEELERRQRDSQQGWSPVFLVVYGLHRFRDLRKAEDDFGFGRRGEEKTVAPAERFSELVREGAALGIHVLVWCDSLANAQRSLDRSGMREFDMRVLFQMSVADSSSLIDTPQASRLGLHRALFATEELSAPEKFRPYQLPSEDWLKKAAEKVRKLQELSPA